MRTSGWMAVAEAAGRAAGAEMALCLFQRNDSWPAVLWAEPSLRASLRGWKPSPCANEPLNAGQRVAVGAPMPEVGLLPGLQQELAVLLPGSAAISLRLQGRPPALLWLGFRRHPPDSARLTALADLVEAVGTRLPSRQQLFMEQAPLVFMTVDRRGVVRDCNEAVLAMGYRPEELIGQPAETIYARGERERLVALMRSAGGLAHYNVTIRHRSGEAIPADLVVGFIRDEDGEVLEAVGLGRDLRGERRLEHHRRLEAVGRLVSGVAHELNNPLMMVVGNAEMLLGMKLPTAARRRAERVLAGARRCQDVVDGLLRLRIKRKEIQEIVELEPVIRGVVRLLAGEFPDLRAQLELPDEVLRVRGDAADLGQAIGHLLRNAFQAVEGRPRPEVRLRLERELEMARITVEDNGPGMSPEVLGRAFEPFYTTREVGKGRGLGLSIAMGVVQDHGGFLELRCPAGGTVAAISLPLTDAQR